MLHLVEVTDLAGILCCQKYVCADCGEHLMKLNSAEVVLQRLVFIW